MTPAACGSALSIARERSVTSSAGDSADGQLCCCSVLASALCALCVQKLLNVSASDMLRLRDSGDIATFDAYFKEALARDWMFGVKGVSKQGDPSQPVRRSRRKQPALTLCQ